MCEEINHGKLWHYTEKVIRRVSMSCHVQHTCLIKTVVISAQLIQDNLEKQ